MLDQVGSVGELYVRMVVGCCLCFYGLGSGCVLRRGGLCLSLKPFICCGNKNWGPLLWASKDF